MTAHVLSTHVHPNVTQADVFSLARSGSVSLNRRMSRHDDAQPSLKRDPLSSVGRPRCRIWGSSPT